MLRFNDIFVFKVKLTNSYNSARVLLTLMLADVAYTVDDDEPPSVSKDTFTFKLCYL